MNREIKFRAWDKEAKTMYEAKAIDFESKQVFIREENFDVWLDFNDVILMQFTGLYDKNDKEIYDGDVLSVIARGMFYYVGFENGMFCIYNNLGRWATMERGIEVCKELNVDFEIIGNTHQNPELLK